MSIYILWFALPPAAAVLAEAFTRDRRKALAVSGQVAFAAAPLALIVLALTASGAVKLKDVLPEPPDPCFDTGAYSVLARQPPGLVLGEVDLGSYVLADTPSSALSAPYHRMAWGNLAAHAALSAPIDQAQGEARALNTAYVLECRAHRGHYDRAGLPADALQRRLDAGRPPAWLAPLSPPGAPLQVYRVVYPG
jgi:hypothetical protein